MKDFARGSDSIVQATPVLRSVKDLQVSFTLQLTASSCSLRALDAPMASHLKATNFYRSLSMTVRSAPILAMQISCSIAFVLKYLQSTIQIAPIFTASAGKDTHVNY